MEHLFKKYNLPFKSLTANQRQEVIARFPEASAEDNFRYSFMTRFPDARTVREAIFLDSRRTVTVFDRMKERLTAPSNSGITLLSLPATLYSSGALITLVATVLKGVSGVEHHSTLITAQGLGAMLFVVGFGMRVGMWLSARSIK